MGEIQTVKREIRYIQRRRYNRKDIIIIDTDHPDWEGYEQFNKDVYLEPDTKVYEWNAIKDDPLWTRISKPRPTQQRNDICKCGTGRKYKKCCMRK